MKISYLKHSNQGLGWPWGGAMGWPALPPNGVGGICQSGPSAFLYREIIYYSNLVRHILGIIENFASFLFGTP